MRKLVIVASSLLLPVAASLCAPPVLGADLDWRSDRSLKDEPIVVPRRMFSWTGFYIGGHIGYGWGDSSSVDATGDAFDGGTDGFVIHPSGWLGGAQGGFNWQYGNTVVGVEADLGYLGVSDDESTAVAFVDTEYGGYGTLAARLGWAEERWLFYLKGGLALAQIENSAGAIALGVVDATDLTQADEIHAGWTLGAGVEYAFQPNWSLKFEYLYMDFGSEESANADGDRFEHDNELHTVKVGLNYRVQMYAEPLQ